MQRVSKVVFYTQSTSTVTSGRRNGQKPLKTSKYSTNGKTDIPSTKSYLLAAQQEPGKKAYL